MSLCSFHFLLSPVPVGIPTLVIVDRDGKVVTSSARAAISSDPDGVVRS